MVTVGYKLFLPDFLVLPYFLKFKTTNNEWKKMSSISKMYYSDSQQAVNARYGIGLHSMYNDYDILKVHHPYLSGKKR